MPIPKLWSKLEDAGDVTAPQIGTGGSVGGSPVFAPSKFGNGIWSDENYEYCTFPTVANSINLDKGTIEFWGKMKFPKTEALFHTLWDFLAAPANGIYLFFDPNSDDFGVKVYQGGSLRASIITSGINFSEEDLMHFGVTWDREGNDIGGGKTLALYIDNVLKASHTITWNTGTINVDLYVGARASNQTEYSNIVIDNLKTFDTCKTDFSDRNVEESLYSGPVVNSDIKWYRSANWEEGDSHGGNINLSSEIISDELGNIFDDVSDEERIVGTTEYRKVYIYLDKEVILFNLKLWIDQSALSPDGEISICVEGITNEDTQEDAENYEYISPANFGEAVVFGDLEHLNYYPIWIRRIVSPYAVPWHHSTFKLMVGF